ncbi:MAG: response regulator transcription factor [Candidatus Dormibacteraceae bacterium]
MIGALEGVAIISPEWDYRHSGGPWRSEYRCIDAGSAAPVKTHSGKSIRILIVEDDEAIAGMYRLQLELDGYAVDVVGSVASAIKVIEAGETDLMLLDIGLPGADGFELLEWLAASGSTSPVVLISNFSTPDLIERARRLGVAEYRVKSSTTPSELALTVAAVLRNGMGGNKPKT